METDTSKNLRRDSTIAYVHMRRVTHSLVRRFMHFMTMMMNCFCGVLDRQKTFSLISSRNHCQRSSPSRISDTPRAGFEPAQSLSSDLVKWSCAVVITTTPRRHNVTPSPSCVCSYVRTYLKAVYLAGSLSVHPITK